MIRISQLGLCSLLISIAACDFDSKSDTNTTGAASTNPSSEATALMQTSRDWAKATASGDVNKILSYWSDHAVVLEPDMPALVGKGAIGSMVETSMKTPKFSITWEPERAFISKSGDVGYLIEHNKVTFPDSSGKVQTQFGKCVTIWNKDSTGTWKNVIDICNKNPTERVFPGP